METNPTNRIKKFLVTPEHSHAKESILMNKLMYDFKLAAGLSGYHLYSYSSDVDHEGFDIIFDDQDEIKKMQVKTFVQGATATWKIHKRILRPRLDAIDKLGFDFSPTGEGNQGGVILMELSVTDSSLNVKYYYTDIIIIVAFIHGIIWRRKDNSQQAIQRVYNELHSGVSHEKVSVPKGCFLSTANAEQVLALAGFHNNISTCCWIHNLLTYSAFKSSSDRYPLSEPESNLKGAIAEEIKKFTDDDIEFAK